MAFKIPTSDKKGERCKKKNGTGMLSGGVKGKKGCGQNVIYLRLDSRMSS
jgi:hypothetical protein